VQIGRFASLLCLLLAILPATARAAPEGKKSGKAAQELEDQLEAIVEEYEAIDSNQDLEQTRRRRLLAERLGGISHPKSRKLLLRMVEEDRDLRTKIVAMESLAKVGTLAEMKRLFRYVLKEQRTVLPDYLGPALSHATDPEIGPWVADKLIGHGHKIIRLSGIEAAGALRAEEALEPLFKVWEKESKRARRDMHLFYELVRAFGQIGGEGVREILEKAAADEDWRMRLAAAEVLTIHFQDEAALEIQRKLLMDEKPIVREIAAVATGERKLEPLFPELVIVMREGNLRSKHKAYEALKAISDQDYGYAPDAWARWWSDKKQGKLTEQGDIKNKETMSVATYYNFKVFSDRVLFVIDVSGSMNDPEFHPNRIEVAHRELKKTIQALSEKTLFNVMTFSGHVELWQKKGEIPATDANKEAALIWLERRLFPRGGTNTYEALMRSLSDNPLVDTVYFLSDGIPSRGKYELPEEILIKLRYANRFRKVIFNTVAVVIGRPTIEKALKYEDPDEMVAFMTQIADLTGGKCLPVRKPFLDR
jgi:HEAT repeat protein